MNKVKLKDILDVKRGTSLAGDKYSESGEYIRLTLGNFNYPNMGFKENTSKKDIYYIGNVRNEFILKKGDIITPLTEQVKGLLGETARIPEDNKYIQSGDIGLVIPNENVLDKNYAYYLISSDIIREQLSNAAQQTKIRHTSPDKIKDCIYWLPSLDEQKNIALFLDSINVTIKNNINSIETAKELIDLMYDRWFLQFDFENNNNLSYKSNNGDMTYSEQLGMLIPKGWEVKQYKDICNTLLGGTPDTGNSNYWNGNIFWLNSGEIANFPIVTSETKITEEGLNSSATKLLKRKTTVISITGNIRTSILSIDSCANQSVIGIEENQLLKSSYIYPAITRLIERFIKVSSGNCQQHINKGTIDNSFILIPESNVLNKYYEYCEPVLENILNLGIINNELLKLRDFYSKLLLNGQIKLKEVE